MWRWAETGPAIRTRVRNFRSGWWWIGCESTRGQRRRCEGSALLRRVQRYFQGAVLSVAHVVQDYAKTGGARCGLPLLAIAETGLARFFPLARRYRRAER